MHRLFVLLSVIPSSAFPVARTRALIPVDLHGPQRSDLNSLTYFTPLISY